MKPDKKKVMRKQEKKEIDDEGGERRCSLHERFPATTTVSEDEKQEREWEKRVKKKPEGR